MASAYWLESIGQALDDLEIRLTDDQIKSLAYACEGIAECESQYTGRDCIPDPRTTEIERLKRAHAAELAAEKRRGELVERKLIERSGGEVGFHHVRVDGTIVEVTR